MNNYRQANKVALCPHCDAPFHYIEFKAIGGINDDDRAAVTCESCRATFAVPVTNYELLRTQPQQNVRKIETTKGQPPESTSIAEHNIPRDRTNWNFNPTTAALHVCPKTGSSLEDAAYAVVAQTRSDLLRAWTHLEHFLAKNGRSGDNRVVLTCDVACSCGIPHTAVFYAPTYVMAHGKPPLDQRCLLAHITGTDYEDRLTCILSKSEAMELLEKLLIRWNLTCRAIVVTSPFVGYKYLDDEKKRGLWDWLHANLEPNKTMVLTRNATWKEFKSLQEGAGIPYETLESFGLTSTLVGKGKTNFHAKFFAGVAEEGVEVLSGSANLVTGPSFENIAFKRMTEERFKTKYMDVLKSQIPTGDNQRPHYALQLNGQAWNWCDLNPMLWKTTLWK